jgi:hypothetical protein
VAGLRLPPAKVLVDGNRLPRLAMRAEAVVKGDALVRPFRPPPSWPRSPRPLVRRGRCAMAGGFAAHKGYGTAAHLAALQAHGACALHRRSLRPWRPRWRKRGCRDEPRPFIHSRDNPLVKDLKRLAQDNGAYRKQGRCGRGRSPVPRGAHPGLAAGAGGVFRVLLACGPVEYAQAAIKT